MLHDSQTDGIVVLILYKQNVQYLFKRKNTLMVLYPNTHCAFPLVRGHH